MPKSLTIDFHCPAIDKGVGYGRAYFEIRDHLIRLGANLIEPYSGGADIQIYMGVPFDDLAELYQRKSEKFLIFTMWESSKLVPQVVRNLDQFDGIITPSKWCEKIYRDMGYNKPIYRVPLGINPDDWEYIERREKEDGFTILWQGTYSETKKYLGDRKGSNLVMECFKELAIPNSRLVLKVTPRYMRNPVQHRFQLPGNILLIGEELSLEDLKSTFAYCDASVFSSYCEGFGLIPLEHLACGLPLIIANNTGMQEFINDKYMIPIDCEAIQGALGFDTGIAFKPDKEQIKKAILWVYEHPHEANVMAKAASEWVKTNWTYERSAKILMEAIETHARL